MEDIKEETLFIDAMPVTESGCWIWLSQSRPAVRLAWTIRNGKIRPGCTVVHTCGCDSCVNPAHLILKDRVPRQL